MSVSLTADRSDVMPAAGHRYVVLALAIALLSFCWFGVGAAAQRGPWLDEFWTLWLSQAGVPFRELLLDRWMADLHPPLFSMAHRVVGLWAGDSYVLHRLFNLVALAWVVGFVGFATARYPRSATTLCALVIGWLAIATSVEYFAEMRSYFTQMASLLVLVGSAIVIAESPSDHRPGRDRALAVLVGIDILLVLNLNYLSLAMGGLILSCLGILLWTTGKRRWFWILFGCTVAGLLPVVAFVLAQHSALSTASDNYWVTASFSEAGATFRRVARRAGEANEVVLLGILICVAASALVIRGRRLPADRRAIGSMALRRTDLGLVLVFGGAALLFMAFLMAAHLRSPVVTGRYLLGWQVGVLAVLIMLSAPIWRRVPVLLLGLAIASVVHQAASSQETRGEPRWNASLVLLQEQLLNCPSSPVYSARFSRPGLMRYETDVRRYAHERMADWSGIALTFIDPNNGDQIPASRGECPTLLWIEHVAWRLLPPEPDAESVLRYLGLAAEPFMLTESSVLVGDSGMVLVLPSR